MDSGGRLFSKKPYHFLTKSFEEMAVKQKLGVDITKYGTDEDID